jgi:hypothetical protein
MTILFRNVNAQQRSLFYLVTLTTRYSSGIVCCDLVECRRTSTACEMSRVIRFIPSGTVRESIEQS